MLRGADIGSDYPLLMAKLRLKIAKVRKGESGLVRFEVSKLKDLEVGNAFKLALHNRFEERRGHVGGGSFGPLQQDME